MAKEKRISSNRISGLVVATFAAITLSVTLVGFLYLRHVEQLTKQDMAGHLQSYLNTNKKALATWAEDEKLTVATWANLGEIRHEIAALTAIAAKNGMRKAELLGSPHAQYLRGQLTAVMKENRYAGFRVIDKNGLTIAAQFDNFVGTPPPTELASYLRRAIAGETLLSPIVTEPLPFPNSKGIMQGGQQFIFSISPVYDEKHALVAVLAFRIRPENRLDKIMNLVRSSDSGESYAFNKQGMMLTASRFQKDMEKAGLADAAGPQEIQLRNPGGNIAKGYKPQKEIKDRPLTAMAQSAIRGEHGVDTDGYPDYRGVPVIGAWEWLPEYGIGIAVEIDVSDAYRTLKTSRAFAIGALLLVTLLAVAALVMYIMKNRIRSSETELRTVLDTAADGVITLNEAGKIQIFNRAAEQIFGYSYAEVAGEDVTMLMPTAGGEKLPASGGEFVEKLIPEMLEKRKEVFRKRKDGSVFPAQVSLREMRIGGERHFMALIQDITERKQIEENLEQAKKRAEEANKTKSLFLSSMSHEIRTPMNAIMGMAELLSETPLNDEQKKYLGMLRGAGEHLLRIINDVLDFSKIEAGKMELETVDFDLIELMDTTVEIMALKSREKNLELAWEMEPETPTLLAGDPARLRQVLLNLIGNAIKFTTQGSVLVKVGKKPEAAADGELLFLVTDTGMGIPKEKLDAIFQDFTQVDSSITRKFGGTGLGLAICRRLVEMMHGRIWAESEPGKGSSLFFTCTLGVQKGKIRQPEKDAEKLGGVKVLLLDPSPIYLLAHKRMLTSWGMALTCAEDRESAISELKAAVETGTPYQLLLINCYQEKADGCKITEDIRREPGLANLAVVSIGSHKKCSSHHLARGGINCTLVRPVRHRDLLETILSALGHSPLIAQPKTNETAATPDATAMPLRLLLVDDTSDNRLMIKAFLKSTGHIIDAAENGQVAVDMFKKSPYDVVLMDVQMPVMDGYTATEEIRKWEQEKGLRRTPVIALTAHAMKEDEERSMKAGCDAHVTKPVKKAVLIKAIEDAISQLRQNR